MKLIKPSNISGEIMTLIEEADEKVILVSPYCRISKWRKFLNKMEDLKTRQVELEFYIRSEEPNTYNEVKQLGVEPIEIPNLHAKIYINERYGIVSSMNLLLSSDTNSLDIAYKTENEKEYRELVEYYERYISNHKSGSVSGVEYDFKNRESELEYELSRAFESDVYVQVVENKLLFNAHNNYEAFIHTDNGKHWIRMNGILSQNEYRDALEQVSWLTNNIGCPVELYRPNDYTDYHTIWASSNRNISNWRLENLSRKDFDYFKSFIIGFALGVDKLKAKYRW